MRTFDVQSIALATPESQAFDFIANPANLPKWTSAFTAADEHTATMATPAGKVDIQLKTITHHAAGTVDWLMTFPDGAVGAAYSRVTPDGAGKCVYSFVLMAPPVPLEALEGALDMQKKTLADELMRLKTLLEGK